VSRVVRKPGDLQIEQAQHDLLGSHRGPECQAPSPGHLLEVLGRRAVLVPALRENLGSMMQRARRRFMASSCIPLPLIRTDALHREPLDHLVPRLRAIAPQPRRNERGRSSGTGASAACRCASWIVLRSRDAT
jgi:hypothetical protein